MKSRLTELHRVSLCDPAGPAILRSVKIRNGILSVSAFCILDVKVVYLSQEDAHSILCVQIIIIIMIEISQQLVEAKADLYEYRRQEQQSS